MHTVVAYSESLNPAGLEVNVAACQDQQVKTAGDEITVPDYNNLFGAMAFMGASPVRARLVSPSLRQINTYDLSNIYATVIGIGAPNDIFHPENPIPLTINESLEALVTGTPGGATQISLVAFLAGGPLSKVQAISHPVRFYVTVAVVAGVWTYQDINFIDDLPVGNYDVIGARFVCASSIAYRFVPVGASYRPGGPCCNAATDKVNSKFRDGGLGVWFTFNTVQLPGIEILASTTPGAATYYGTMDLVKK
jgi:hypothetical protein